MGDVLFRQLQVGFQRVEIAKVSLSLTENFGIGEGLDGGFGGRQLGLSGIEIGLSLTPPLGLSGGAGGLVGLKAGFQSGLLLFQRFLFLQGLLTAAEQVPLLGDGLFHLRKFPLQLGDKAHPAVDFPAVEPVF